MVEEVLIDFKVDFTELTTAQEQLAKSGKIDASGFAAVNKAIKSTATDTKGLIKEFKDVATMATKMGKSVEDAFGAGIKDALDEAGVSVEEFGAALSKANNPSKTLKAELRELKEALALAKVEGRDTGAEFDAMRNRAGLLADAIEDANKEIKNAGSDTRNIDNVVGSISALAGGFAAVQGAAALFGEENEDVQKALLKVNGAMAIASGIQQFYNATLKEGSLAKLADSIQTKGAAAAQAIYTTAVGASTGALKLFRIALLATGIGAIVAVLYLAADAMGVFGDSTGDTTADLKAQKEAADDLVNSLDDIASASARARAAQADGSDNTRRQIELAKARGNSSQEVFNLEQKLRKQEIGELSALANTYVQTYNTRKKLGTLTVADAEAITNKINEINKQGLDKRNEIEASAITFTRERAEKAQEAAKKATERAQKDAAAARAQRESDLRDILANIEKQLLFVEKGTQEELDLKKQAVIAKRDIELNAEKLTAAQSRLIRAKAYSDQLELQEQFNKRLSDAQLQAQIDTNEAILAGVGLTNEARLQLQIENITAIAQQEVVAAEGNAAKILLIEAKKIADIRTLRNKAIDDDLAAEISASQKTNDIVKNALNKVAADSTQSLESRIAAVESLGKQELINIDRAIKANNEKVQSDEDYQKNYKKLADERAQIEQDTKDKIADVVQDDKEERIAALREVAAVSIEVASQVADFFSQLNDLAAEQENQRLAEQRRNIEALLEAGAITEKEAENRFKKLELAERQAKQRQAQREKQEAVFRALLAIPSAVLQGLSQGGPVLAAIYGALAAAQAALVIARPVPKFFRGKKGNYEGPGIVGDMGPELVIQGGKPVLYTKPTHTYLGARDKVYTAAETRQIMHNTNVLATSAGGSTQERFDYDRFAKAIPKAGLHVNINKDGITSWTTDQLSKQKSFDKWYRS